MRVLLTTDSVGGVWTFTRELTIGLLDRGHRVVLVSLGPAPSYFQRRWISDVKARYVDAFRFDSFDAPLEWMQSNDSAYSAAADLLLRILEEFRVDIVHTSQFCFGALPIELPKLITAHSDVLSWAEACQPEGLAESEWLRTYRSLVKDGLAGASVLVAPTHWMRDAFLRHFSLSPEIRVVLNGLTLTAATSNSSRKLQAVSMGRLWDKGKGLAVLDGLSSPMPVYVAGELRFEGGQFPAMQGVELLGRLEQADVLELLRNSSLYLVTSIYEPFGLAPIEAALCGCGIVARDIASLREVWGDAAEYFTDREDLNAVLSRLFVSHDELESLRARSAARAHQLSATRMVESYLELYTQLVAAQLVQEEAAYAL